MLKNIQILGIQQKLSPQLIQAQLLLAVPTLALEQEIKLQLESNPLLEELTENDQEETEEKEVKETETETTAEETPEADDTLPKGDEETYDLDEWYDYSDNQIDGYKSPEQYEKQSQTDYDNKTDYLINKSNRLKETPLDQLHRSGLEEKYILIGEEIIGSLDDDGYLRDSIDDIISDIVKQYNFEVTHEDVEKVIKIIHRFDPIGLGSRNLQECLSVQIEELNIDNETKELCLKLVNECFNEFKSKHYEKLSKQLKIPLEKVNELFNIIHKLNPIPGNIDGAPEREYIYPDFIVTKVGDELVVELTDEYIPSIKISRRYVKMLKSKGTPRQTKEFLKNKLDAAKWFMNSIVSRRETMMKVMKAIVERQRKFFLTNGENLKPIYEKDIASDINMDISTVSRTVRNKYVQTDFGTYELKYFFSNPIQMDSGEDVSSKIVKEKIRDFIEKEDKSKPLSDDKLTLLMNEIGYPIARRTVAKYREAMKIPKATLRRKIVL
ncbi:MAG: RNA polymerase sigma-54 factor [Ignavibacteriae bacterium]|nr:MAG: RNA polymerase sigma-54 factor [Ignavibacteriota bacterium]